MTEKMQVVCIGPANVEIPFQRSRLLAIDDKPASREALNALGALEGKRDLATYLTTPGTDRDAYVLVIQGKQKRIPVSFTAPSAIQYKPAGSALNIATGFVGVGAAVRLVTPLVGVPHDDLSSRIRAYVMHKGIRLVEVSRPITPVTFIIVDGDDEREKSTVLSYKPPYTIPRADARKALKSVKQERRATHVLATGIRMPELTLTRKAFRRARQRSAMTCFIPNPSILLPNKKIRHQLQQVMLLADVLQMNDREAEVFLGKSEGSLLVSDIVRVAQQTRVPTLIVTRGAQGAVAYVDGKCHEVAAYQATPKVVDTTGAGDAFLMGFVFALHEGCTVDEALQLAAFSATSNIMALGGHGGMPSREQLLWRLSQLRTPDTIH